MKKNFLFIAANFTCSQKLVNVSGYSTKHLWCSTQTFLSCTGMPLGSFIFLNISCLFPCQMLERDTFLISTIPFLYSLTITWCNRLPTESLFNYYNLNLFKLTVKWICYLTCIYIYLYSTFLSTWSYVHKTTSFISVNI